MGTFALLSTTLVLVCVTTVTAQTTTTAAPVPACKYPDMWYAKSPYYFEGYTSTNARLLQLNDSTWSDITAGFYSTCNGLSTAGGTTVISFTSSQNAKQYCVEVIFEDVAMFVRTTPEVTRDVYSTSECSTLLGAATQFKAYISFPFGPVAWMDTPPGPPAGQYMFTYKTYKVISGQETECIDAAATLTIAGNVWTTSSTCVTGAQSYTNPFGGNLLSVAGLSDTQLSVATGTSTSGMLILAMDVSTKPPVAGVNYKFLIVRYAVTKNSDESSELDLFFTSDNPQSPTGYLTMDQVPVTSQTSLNQFSLRSSECSNGLICNNGGICIQQWMANTCACTPGYDGTNCDNNINECANTPCDNGGTCTDLVNGFLCECAAGFAGTTCTLTDACDPDPCDNGATCYTFNGGFLCDCPELFYGQKCEDVDICERDEPCQNEGSCFNTDGDYHCFCPYGYVGKNCETLNITASSCQDINCQNDGECVTTQTGSYCECTIYFEGDFCQDLSDWFIVALVLLILLVLIILILLVVCCCYCCCGWRPNAGANYETMNNSESSLKLDTPAPAAPPSTVEFNFSPASPYYGIQMMRNS